MIPEVRRRRLTFLLRIVASSSVFGAVYGSIVALASGLPLTPVAIIDGAGIGAGIALLCMSYDSLLLPSRLGEALRRGPFLLLVAVKTIWYGASIVLALYIGSAL